MSQVIIKGGGGGAVMSDDITATTAEVRSGFTALTTDSDDEIANGTMPDNGAVTSNLDCSESYDVPLGYHNGSGKITANSLASQTVSNAEAGDIKLNQTAWVNGEKIVGTMPIETSGTVTLKCSETYQIPAGYHDGSEVVTAETLAAQTPGDLTAAYLLSGRGAWVNGNYISGSVGVV